MSDSKNVFVYNIAQDGRMTRQKGNVADKVVIGDGDSNILSYIQHLIQLLLSHIEEKGIIALELLEQEDFGLGDQGNM
eukprot:13568467-Ditylum_brightwellii.AAC.1